MEMSSSRLGNDCLDISKALQSVDVGLIVKDMKIHSNLSDVVIKRYEKHLTTERSLRICQLEWLHLVLLNLNLYRMCNECAWLNCSFFEPLTPHLSISPGLLDKP